MENVKVFKFILFLFHMVKLQPDAKQGSIIVFQTCGNSYILVTFNMFLLPGPITYCSFGRTGLGISALSATLFILQPVALQMYLQVFVAPRYPVYSHSHKMLLSGLR